MEQLTKLKEIMLGKYISDCSMCVCYHGDAAIWLSLSLTVNKLCGG